MGWSCEIRYGYNKPTIKEVKEHLDSIYTWESDKAHVSVKMSSIKFGEYYAVVRMENKDSGDVKFIGACSMWSASKSEICHKDMDESCGPVINNAPKKHIHFLNEYSPITDEMVESSKGYEWARNWRESVLNRKAPKKVKSGQRVEFAHPITFSGEDFTVFTVVKSGRNTFFRPEGKSWVGRIRKYGMKDFKILKEDNDE